MAEADAAPASDLLIIGGGPAGLATAIAARLSGMTATVIERRQPPLDKACGEGLMPDGVRLLTDMGVVVRGRPFRGIAYIDGDTIAQSPFPAGHGLGVRRIRLHEALVERASQLGAWLHWGVSVESMVAGGVHTERGFYPGTVIVGADGLHSVVRRWAGLEGPPAHRRRYGVRRHYALAPWNDHVEVYWSDGAEAYVTPVGDSEVGVAMLWGGDELGVGFDELLCRFPALAERLRAYATVSADRGAGPFEHNPRAVVGDGHGVALVGDAAGYLDAITGEGLSLALHQAQALVAALAAGDMGSYARVHRRLGLVPARFTRLVLWMREHPRVRRRAIRALAREPRVFERLLGVASRQVPVSRFGVSYAARLVRGVVLA